VVDPNAVEALDRFRYDRRIPQTDDYRAVAERDRDRILYCSAFRRLGSVTQVVAVSETQLFHNRLTHSLKVAQIGRRLAQKLKRDTSDEALFKAGGLDEDVVEAAGLAHDLGHPPFGHIAESELQKCLENTGIDSFEGNAQSFRIVSKFAFRTLKEDEQALNLSRATLNAILKYPWHKGAHPEPTLSNKWGAYRSESADFSFARDGRDDKVPSVEAGLMDWADDIAFAVHDVEDFYRAGIIPLYRLVHFSKESNAFVTRAYDRLKGKGYDWQKCADAFENLKKIALPKVPYSGTRGDRAFLHELASTLITRYVDAAQILPSGRLRINPDRWHEVGVLKQLTWYYVIDNPALASLQRGQRKIIRGLFNELVEWTSEAAKNVGDQTQLPTYLQVLLGAIRNDNEAADIFNDDDDLLRLRAVVDYISSLTEDQAVKLYERLTGSTGSSAMERWLGT
jgi:dGTPase